MRSKGKAHARLEDVLLLLDLVVFPRLLGRRLVAEAVKADDLDTRCTREEIVAHIRVAWVELRVVLALESLRAGRERRPYRLTRHERFVAEPVSVVRHSPAKDGADVGRES